MRIAQWLLGGRSNEYSGLLLGNDASGKTTLLYQLKLGEEAIVIPTIGFNVETYQDQKRREITLWDVGGCDQIRPLVRHYMENKNFILFVHSCTDDRWDFSVEYLRLVLGWLEQFDSTRRIWILLNKQDLLPPAEREAIVADLRRKYEAEIAPYQGEYKITIMDHAGLSATSGEKLDVVMNEIIDTLEDEKKPKSSKPQAKSPELEKGPTDEELLRRIHEADANSQDAEAFWASFRHGDLASWDHFTHLRAGFFVMHDCFAKGSNIFQCADEFLAHLARLRQKNPDRFRNTAHRTLTVFWLVQLQVAMTSYQAHNNLAELPSVEAFRDVVLFAPQLMNTGVWRSYYSKDLLFTPEARENWHLPDLQPLPTTITAPKTSSLQPAPGQGGDPDRLPRFAFAVIQKTLTSKVRRGGIVKQALDTLQTTTFRARASDQSIPPYSETQAYFWIQFVHAALRSLELEGAPESEKPVGFTGNVITLEFSAFKALFGITGQEWRDYYTPTPWEAIPSRMSFVNPDRKPLPNVLAIPSTANVKLARTRMVDAMNYRLTAPLQLPPREELSFIAAVLLDEAKLMPDAELNVASHASLLRFLHRRLSVSPTATKKASTIAAEAALELSQRIGLTQSMFWVQQALLALAKSTAADDFDKFVLENAHLAYEDLPMMYYSPELWYSNEAKEALVPPNRHSSPSVVRRRFS